MDLNGNAWIENCVGTPLLKKQSRHDLMMLPLFYGNVTYRVDHINACCTIDHENM